MAQFKVSDGRQVHYSVSDGGREGPALVFHHGQPGAALPWEELEREARALGWPVVMISRPGYASSDRNAGRTIGDVAPDVAELLDHLEVDQFVTADWSGGGPHALACAALLPSRCRAAAVVAGVAPYGAGDLDWTAGMGPENRLEFEAAIAGDPGLEEQVESNNNRLRHMRADELIPALGGLLFDPDKAVLAHDRAFAQFIASLMRFSSSAGYYGYWDDEMAFVRDWGFELNQISIPVSTWGAGLDLMVPPAHGRWLARNVPGAKMIELPEEGHISLIVRHLGEIVGGLAGAARS